MPNSPSGEDDIIIIINDIEANMITLRSRVLAGLKPGKSASILASMQFAQAAVNVAIAESAP